MAFARRPPHLVSTFPTQQQFLCYQASTRMNKKPLEENAVLPYTETNKPTPLPTLVQRRFDFFCFKLIWPTNSVRLLYNFTMVEN